ncbi:MAG: aromatic amino acid transport family protein [Candidatus Aenigmatarchaeota archaeon]
MRKVLICTWLILATMVGAGILAMPKVFYESGLIFSTILMIISAFVMYVSSLVLIKLEVFRKNIKNLPGLMEIYFNKKAKLITIILLTLSIYFTVFAYLSAIAESVKNYFNPYSFLILIFLINAFIVYPEKYSIENFSSYFTIFRIAFIFFILVFVLYNNLAKIEINIFPKNIFSLISFFAISIFAFSFFVIIPSLKVFTSNEKELILSVKISLILGFILYFFFSLVFSSSKEVATLGYGILTDVLTMIFVISPYIMLSWSLQNAFITDFGIEKRKSFILSSFIPFLLYLILPLSFSKYIELAGGIIFSLLFFLISLLGLKTQERTKINKNYLYLLAIISILLLISVIINQFK